MTTRTIEAAAAIWAYAASFARVEQADAIVVCCSYDLRVCDHACELLAAGHAGRLVFSGKHGNWTRHLWSEPEAEVFRRRALANGVAADRILVDVKATNIGENLRFSRRLIPAANKVIFVSKPNSLLRLELTAAAQWPGVEALVSCPDIAFPDEVSTAIGLWGVIHEMVGDIERIRRYPALGYQAEHRLPARIVDHWRYLIDEGFTGHLLAPPADS